MNETPFYKTRMGTTFYEKTMPALVRAIERLADRDSHEAAAGLLDAVDHLLETEIVPGSEPTREAFATVRLRAKALRHALSSIQRSTRRRDMTGTEQPTR